MLNNEDRFWASLLAGSHPGWSLSMSDAWGDHGSAPAHLSANIYAYDTSTGWQCSCAIAPGDLLTAAEIMDSSQTRRNAAVGHAHYELVRAADGKASAGDDAARRAMALIMYYIAQSDALKFVRRRYGSLQGHWLCLVYRFRQGQSMIRPAFRSTFVGERTLPPHLLSQWAADVRLEDHNAEDSGLLRQLRAGNELLLKQLRAPG